VPVEDPASAALRYCRAQSRPKRVVTFACDSGNKYLSKMFNDAFVMAQGDKITEIALFGAGD
jgi:hypothetical protein